MTTKRQPGSMGLVRAATDSTVTSTSSSLRDTHQVELHVASVGNPICSWIKNYHHVVHVLQDRGSLLLRFLKSEMSLLFGRGSLHVHLQGERAHPCTTCMLSTFTSSASGPKGVQLITYFLCMQLVVPGAWCGYAWSWIQSCL